MSADLGFTHRFVAPTDPTAPVLLLLHGTGGSEHDLIELGREVGPPGAALLSPLGKVTEGSQARFFRRLREGVFDEADLARRTVELADFVRRAVEAYGLAGRPIIALGYSNGANIAGSLLLSGEQVLSGAVLLRSMVPFEPVQTANLTGVRVLLLSGRFDPIVPAANVERLAALLRAGGADVTLSWQPVGHGLTPADVAIARRWLAGS